MNVHFDMKIKVRISGATGLKPSLHTGNVFGNNLYTVMPVSCENG